jgi:hypothetical protein
MLMILAATAFTTVSEHRPSLAITANRLNGDTSPVGISGCGEENAHSAHKHGPQGKGYGVGRVMGWDGIGARVEKHQTKLHEPP